MRPGSLGMLFAIHSQWPSASHAASGRGRPEHDVKVLATVVVPIRAHLYHEVRGSPIWGKRLENSMLCGSYCGLCYDPTLLLIFLSLTSCPRTCPHTCPRSPLGTLSWEVSSPSWSCPSSHQQEKTCLHMYLLCLNVPYWHS